MGIAMAVTTILGLVVGLYLDRVFGTQPWLMIIFLILGVAAGFRNIYITIKKYGF
jgi:ATP synthase protein I